MGDVAVTQSTDQARCVEKSPFDTRLEAARERLRLVERANESGTDPLAQFKSNGARYLLSVLDDDSILLAKGSAASHRTGSSGIRRYYLEQSVENFAQLGEQIDQGGDLWVRTLREVFGRLRNFVASRDEGVSREDQLSEIMDLIVR